jgi:hypothetical protein
VVDVAALVIHFREQEQQYRGCAKHCAAPLLAAVYRGRADAFAEAANALEYQQAIADFAVELEEL